MIWNRICQCCFECAKLYVQMDFHIVGTKQSDYLWYQMIALSLDWISLNRKSFDANRNCPNPFQDVSTHLESCSWDTGKKICIPHTDKVVSDSTWLCPSLEVNKEVP